MTWTVTFVEGRYRFVCDPHATSMRGNFIVGNPPPPPAAPAAAAAGGEEAAADGRARVHDLAAQRGRQGAHALKAGRYAITVRDRAKAAQLPPRRRGREPEDGRRLPRHAAGWTVTLGRARSAGSATRTRRMFAGRPKVLALAPARLTSPAFGPPAARISACRSSSAFSSAPKSSAKAE